MSDVEIFDRDLRRLRRDRAVERFHDHSFLYDHMAEELMARLDLVTRPFRHALNLGCFDGRLTRRLQGRGLSVVSADTGYRFARAAGGVQCDEDRLPFADSIFDLVMSVGVLDSVNDLPGALALIRRILKPDSLFLAAFIGAGSLSHLRSATLAADSVSGRGVAPRIHPQIDVRSAGDLLSRAGFALPVADGERLDVGYASPFRLISDLRGMAGGNLLRGSKPPLGRAHIAALLENFAAAADPDGRVRERFEIVYLAGWSPGPDQPQPARRGSATHSLAAMLKPAADRSE